MQAHEMPPNMIDPEIVADTIREQGIDQDGRMVDNGIGSYEYWGARGVDIQMEYEIDTIADVEVPWFKGEGDLFPPTVSTSHTIKVPAGTHPDDDRTIDMDVMIGWKLVLQGHDGAIYRADDWTY